MALLWQGPGWLRGAGHRVQARPVRCSRARRRCFAVGARCCVPRISSSVAVQRKAVGSLRVAHHHRAHEHHQVGLGATTGFAFEQVAKQGTSPRPGTFSWLPAYSSCNRPPSTTMEPSPTMTLDSMERLLVIRPVADFTEDGSTLETSGRW